MATTYTLISSVTVGSGGVSSVSFNSIPQTYTDLEIVTSTRTTDSQTGGHSVNAEFNSSTTGYSVRKILGNSTGTSSSSATGTKARIGRSDTAAQTASTFASSKAYIPNYTASNNKSISVDAAVESNDNTNWSLHLKASLWANSAAITDIVITISTATIAQYSTFYLYGISNA